MATYNAKSPSDHYRRVRHKAHSLLHETFVSGVRKESGFSITDHHGPVRC